MTTTKQPALPELLPCPFCGGEAEIRKRKTVMVSCTQCSAATFQVLSDAGSATTAWNTRADERERAGREGGIPEGWAVVPREPTKEMVDAFHVGGGLHRYNSAVECGLRSAIASGSRAAAPQPPTAPKEAT